jgi:pentose-5-phosphate-3-epimerase
MEIKRKRGRPLGSLGKKKIQEAEEAVPDNTNAIPVDIREIKKQIRMLRKIKKDTHKKTDERRELNEKIRTLKAKLIPVQVEVTPEKSDIIAKILERRPEYAVLGIVLEGYTIEQLNFHYEKILHKARLF